MASYLTPIRLDAQVQKPDWYKLWMDHISWTRSVIMGIVNNLPGTDAYVKRLLQNAEEMGEAMSLFVGAAAVPKVKALLREHITLAADIVKTAKAGQSVDSLVAKWRKNGEEIVKLFMLQLGPQAFFFALMWTKHLDATLAEATSHLKKDWVGEITAWDRVYTGAMEMAKAFSSTVETKEN